MHVTVRGKSVTISYSRRERNKLSFQTSPISSSHTRPTSQLSWGSSIRLVLVGSQWHCYMKCFYTWFLGLKIWIYMTVIAIQA